MSIVRALGVLIALHGFDVAGSAAAETASAPDQIDRTYQACLDSASGNQAQLRCIEAAAAAWDKVLNANYKAAAAALDDKRRALLRGAQRKWLHYRDADRAFRDSDWRFGDGFDKKVFLADAGMQIVKARAQALATYGPVTE